MRRRVVMHGDRLGACRDPRVIIIVVVIIVMGVIVVDVVLVTIMPPASPSETFV